MKLIKEKKKNFTIIVKFVRHELHIIFIFKAIETLFINQIWYILKIKHMYTMLFLFWILSPTNVKKTRQIAFLTSFFDARWTQKQNGPASL